MNIDTRGEVYIYVYVESGGIHIYMHGEAYICTVRYMHTVLHAYTCVGPSEVVVCYMHTCVQGGGVARQLQLDGGRRARARRQRTAQCERPDPPAAAPGRERRLNIYIYVCVYGGERNAQCERADSSAAAPGRERRLYI